MDPLAGRFLSPDPLDSLVNTYAYTQGNPVELWDASGLSPEFPAFTPEDIEALFACGAAIAACTLPPARTPIGVFVCLSAGYSCYRKAEEAGWVEEMARAARHVIDRLPERRPRVLRDFTGNHDLREVRQLVELRAPVRVYYGITSIRDCPSSGCGNAGSSLGGG